MMYLIIGAGPCGLAMARHLKKNNISYEQVEKSSDIGGNWLNGVYEGVYTDACKDVMQFKDFPMPVSYPDFISGKQMLDYLMGYVAKFDIRSNISFNTTVVSVKQTDDKMWKVHFKESGITKVYDGVIVCNGHHSDMKWPELDGKFEGQIIHSKQYKSPEQLRGKRVLVIGSGNSASDIACEASRIGKYSIMSMRDSPWIFPKSFMGVPLGRLKARNLPNGIQMLLVKLLIKISFGKHSYYNLPDPKHKPFEKHPTVSEELPYYLKHGRIEVKPDVKFISRNTVWFDDGSSNEFDLIVAATGYKLSFPFLEESLSRVEGQHLKCLGYCVYPDVSGLYFMGWPQVRGGVGALSYDLAVLICNLINIESSTGVSAGEIFESMGDQLSSTHLYGNNEFVKFIKRHSYEKMLRTANRLSKKVKTNNEASKLETQCLRSKTIS